MLRKHWSPKILIIISICYPMLDLGISKCTLFRPVFNIRIYPLPTAFYRSLLHLAIGRPTLCLPRRGRHWRTNDQFFHRHSKPTVTSITTSLVEDLVKSIVLKRITYQNYSLYIHVIRLRWWWEIQYRLFIVSIWTFWIIEQKIYYRFINVVEFHPIGNFICVSQFGMYF